METEKRIYLAYGSNLNIKQMAMRCPAAKVIGTGYLPNYRLTFHSVASVAPANGRKVPVALWEITPECEAALDRYEGYPRLYTKKDVYAKLDSGERVKAMVYIMTEPHTRAFSPPSRGYLDTIWQGYKDNGLPLNLLREAVAENQRDCDGQTNDKKDWRRFDPFLK